jgi:superfamily II DNA/RNA helicase
MSDAPNEAKIVAFSATYSETQLESFVKSLEQRGKVTRLFVEEESMIGKVPDNIKVLNINIGSSGSISENLRTKLHALSTLTQALLPSTLDPESSQPTQPSQQVIFFHNFKSQALQIQKCLRKSNLRSVLLNAEQSQQERVLTFEKMRLLQIMCIVATDLIARGVDLPDV